MLHRKRITRLQEEEDATELKLGAEFQLEHCLMYAEVQILMQTIVDTASTSTHHASSNNALSNPVFNKTLAYTTQLSKFQKPETVKEVRKLLINNSDQLESFEMAQLGNLLPETADEAKALIPRYGFYNFYELFLN